MNKRPSRVRLVSELQPEIMLLSAKGTEPGGQVGEVRGRAGVAPRSASVRPPAVPRPPVTAGRRSSAGPALAVCLCVQSLCLRVCLLSFAGGLLVLEVV